MRLDALRVLDLQKIELLEDEVLPVNAEENRYGRRDEYERFR